MLRRSPAAAASPAGQQRLRLGRGPQLLQSQFLLVGQRGAVPKEGGRGLRPCRVCSGTAGGSSTAPGASQGTRPKPVALLCPAQINPMPARSLHPHTPRVPLSAPAAAHRGAGESPGGRWLARVPRPRWERAALEL